MKVELAELSQLKSVTALSQSCSESDLSEAFIAKAIKKQQLWCWTIDSAIVGFIVESQVLDEAELIQLIVHPSFRRQGYASIMLAYWHQSIVDRQVTQAFLEVRDGNSPAENLYKKHGYELLNKRKNYYQHDNQLFDALVMVKNLIR
ncbi:ribosomal protein S18-alanine N-acetyltransferase [Reinekea thalattae]|uniref:[Ribosomal protein bS18]-alanine N-acetyltransferase n=1 Tax=Reinekea thalattae TaxID=2593301 RepID=A0A5C8YZE1_9GAMM|nr:ribosomal protein S18-alanine N-acetyltransferase [Reinekea thalattae]TXR51252.1 ribosomal-protein-alanine N-acetyltransferase [Reinekea thalattae]